MYSGWFSLFLNWIKADPTMRSTWLSDFYRLSLHLQPLKWMSSAMRVSAHVRPFLTPPISQWKLNVVHSRKYTVQYLTYNLCMVISAWDMLHIPFASLPRSPVLYNFCLWSVCVCACTTHVPHPRLVLYAEISHLSGLVAVHRMTSNVCLGGGWQIRPSAESSARKKQADIKSLCTKEEWS